jgi:hypothetical protein
MTGGGFLPPLFAAFLAQKTQKVVILKGFVAAECATELEGIYKFGLG